jgi:hypothetical protein
MNEVAPGAPRLSSAKRRMIVYILLMVVFAVMYRLLVRHRLEQTSALFIGLPALLAILTVMFGRAKSATGSILIAITMAVCISGIFLGEGFICIVMAAPLFYAVGAIIGGTIDYYSRYKKRNTLTCIMVLVYLPMSFEGVTPRLSFSRDVSVTAERVVLGDAASVRETLAESPDIDQPIPIIMQRFPLPKRSWGHGLKPGDTRGIHFAGGEGAPGDLVMVVTESSAERVVFRAVSDTSKIAHWLSWESAIVEWTPIDQSHTRVRWTLNYRRELDPAWYFGPWEHYAVTQAAKFLVTANADPSARRRP